MSSGGKRPGAGRKKGKQNEKAVVQIRHDKEVVERVRKKYKGKALQDSGREWLNHLAGSELRVPSSEPKTRNK